MKNLSLLLVTLFLLSAQTALGQKKAKKNTTEYVSPFSKGTLSFTNRPNLTYTNFSGRTNGNPKSFDFRIDPSYYIMKGLAIGLDLRAGSISSKVNNKSSFSSWQADLTVTYGRQLVDRLSAYIKIFAGPGHSKSEFDLSTYGTNPQKTSAKYVDLKGMIGFPVALDGNGAAFLTPYFSYDYYKTDAGISSFKERTTAFGIRLETYLNSANMKDRKEKQAFADNSYTQGSHFLDFNTIAGFSSDNRQQYQTNSTLSFGKNKIKNSNFGIGYNYYVIDNLAVGLNINYSSNSQGYGGANSTSKTSTFMAGPTLSMQAPLKGAGHNLFLQAGYSFGTYKEPKKKLTDLSVKAGYNIPLAKFLTLTPKIGYENIKGKVPSGVSGIPYINSGLVAEIGVRSWLNFKRWK